MNDFVRSKRRVAVALLLALQWTLFAGSSAVAAEAGGPVKVVYHIDDAGRATGAMRMMSNHLKAIPSAKIVVVALADGIEFMLSGAKDSRGNPYEPMIDDLILQGVEFRACNNTLTARQIDRSRLHPDVAVVDSGVAEISRLQAFQGFVYLKP